MGSMRACVADLLSQELYSSAEAMASLCVSGAKPSEAPQARAEDCVLRGDALINASQRLDAFVDAVPRPACCLASLVSEHRAVPGGGSASYAAG